MSQDNTKSLALLVADGLRFTDTIDDEKLDDVIYALTLIVRGNVTDEEEHDFFKRLLNNGWQTVAAFQGQK